MRNWVRNYESNRLRSSLSLSLSLTRRENPKACLHFEAKEEKAKKIVMKDVRDDLQMSNSQNEASGRVT